VAALAAGSEAVVLAMRPPDVAAALAELAPVLQSRALLSLAAAVPLDDLRAGLAPGARVARVMPNVAAAIGRGVFLLVAGTLSAVQAGEVRDLFGLAGTVVDVPERLFDAATAVAGCGPGFTALFIEALAAAGVQRGSPSRWPGSSPSPPSPGRRRWWRATATPRACARRSRHRWHDCRRIEVLETRGMRTALAAAVAAAVERAGRGR